jgi:hypothetical protein
MEVYRKSSKCAPRKGRQGRPPPKVSLSRGSWCASLAFRASTSPSSTSAPPSHRLSLIDLLPAQQLDSTASRHTRKGTRTLDLSRHPTPKVDPRQHTVPPVRKRREDDAAVERHPSSVLPLKKGRKSALSTQEMSPLEPDLVNDVSRRGDGSSGADLGGEGVEAKATHCRWGAREDVRVCMRERVRLVEAAGESERERARDRQIKIKKSRRGSRERGGRTVEFEEAHSASRESAMRLM